MVPRYRYNVEVTIYRKAEKCFAGRTSDVSLSGMGLQLTREVVIALAQGGNLLTPGDHFDVIFSPYVESVDGVIGPTLPARVRHVRRLSQHDYHVGVWFEDIDEPQQKALEGLVAKAVKQSQRTR